MADTYMGIPGEKGNINVSEDVIRVITGAALREVDGIGGLAATVGAELQELLGKKLSKGIKVSFARDGISIDVAVTVCYGKNIASAAKAAQNAVITAVESMTGIVPVVNVHVAGIAFDK